MSNRSTASLPRRCVCGLPERAPVHRSEILPTWWRRILGLWWPRWTWGHPAGTHKFVDLSSYGLARDQMRRLKRRRAKELRGQGRVA